jgi:2-polyprenyl-3-methyl-5-hydroxy-6-metoxy-1,4-benzoquinol methylase
MLRCKECAAVFTFPAPPSDVIFSRYSQSWFEKEYLPSYAINLSYPDSQHLASRYSSELEMLEEFRETSRLLDVGAGAGLFLNHAKGRNWEVYGVETSEYGVNFCKSHFGIDLVQGTLEEAQFPSDFFDAVIIQDTIEHVHTPHLLMTEVNRILRPSGVVAISTPNFNGVGRKVFGKYWSLVSPAEHLCLFAAKSLRTMLHQTGFAVITIETTDEVNTSRYHGSQDLSLGVRKHLAKFLAKTITSSTVRRLRVGDELYCRAIKREYPPKSSTGLR